MKPTEPQRRVMAELIDFRNGCARVRRWDNSDGVSIECGTEGRCMSWAYFEPMLTAGWVAGTRGADGAYTAYHLTLEGRAALEAGA